jgi:hypothetical protein
MDEFNNYNSDQSTSDNGYNTDFTQSNDYYNQYGNDMQPQGKGKAIAALVLGIVAVVFFCCCTYIGIICGVLAVIFGILEIKKNGEGKGMAIAGTICGGIGAVAGIIMTIINFVNISNGENELYNNLMSQLEGAIQLIIK